jgi:hypothetical protein
VKTAPAGDEEVEEAVSGEGEGEEYEVEEAEPEELNADLPEVLPGKGGKAEKPAAPKVDEEPVPVVDNGGESSS